jgi:hypothetical protein
MRLMRRFTIKLYENERLMYETRSRTNRLEDALDDMEKKLYEKIRHKRKW